MSSIVDRVANGLQKLKAIQESPANLAERDKIIK